MKPTYGNIYAMYFCSNVSGLTKLKDHKPYKHEWHLFSSNGAKSSYNYLGGIEVHVNSTTQLQRRYNYIVSYNGMKCNT